MNQFFQAPSEIILGCDPGPQHSAFAVINCKDGGLAVDAVAYLPNKEISEECISVRGILGMIWDRGVVEAPCKYDLDKMVYVFEKCSVQAGGANSLVFETSMTAGELRHIISPCVKGAYAFSPSDWRYILTGKGCANDTIVRQTLLTILPKYDIICRSYSSKAKKALNLKKPITSHLRDAAGVALAAGFLDYRKGLKLSQFPARLEVTCG